MGGLCCLNRERILRRRQRNDAIMICVWLRIANEPFPNRVHEVIPVSLT